MSTPKKRATLFIHIQIYKECERLIEDEGYTRKKAYQIVSDKYDYSPVTVADIYNNKDIYREIHTS